LKNGKNSLEDNIEKEGKRLTENKGIFKNLKKGKDELDKKLIDLREKINQSERIKTRYMNIIYMYVPLKLDQFSKFEVSSNSNEKYNRLSSDISKALLFTKTKMNNLKKIKKDMDRDNHNLRKDIDIFDRNFKKWETEKKLIEKKRAVILTKFNNDQILKFGFIINFDALLDASKSTLADKLEAEYKILKKDADRQIDEYVDKINEAKIELQSSTTENTVRLEEIKQLLMLDLEKDKLLEGKNSELSVIYFLNSLKIIKEAKWKILRIRRRN
jgi:hypothetical protein